MPWNSPGGLSREKDADILAFILKRGGVPAGASELPAQAEPQRQIRMLVTRP